MLPNDFCVFILTHGRPDRVHTYDSLMKAGYTGRLYIVIDDEDKTAEGYRQRFGDKVLQFCKAEWAEKTDEGDNFQHRKAIVYARNACWDLARQVGCTQFVQLDDDYTGWYLRYNAHGDYVSAGLLHTTNDVFDNIRQFALSSGASAVAMCQGGDHIGGFDGKQSPRLSRKCMNSWFCNTDRQFQFFGHMNEDVSAYVANGRRGRVFFTVMQMQLNQKPTQITPGGMSDLYASSGTYAKSFYTVMAAPSCTQIGLMGDHRGGNEPRIHHKINWHAAAPKILDERHRKPR